MKKLFRRLGRVGIGPFTTLCVGGGFLVGFVATSIVVGLVTTTVLAFTLAVGVMVYD